MGKEQAVARQTSVRHRLAPRRRRPTIRTCRAEEQDEEQCKDMGGCVVVLLAAFASARRPVVLVSAAQLSLEDMCGDLRESCGRCLR